MKRIYFYKKGMNGPISIAAGILAAVLIFAFSAAGPAEAAGSGRGFTSPDEAVKALVAAVSADDEKEMMAILGPGSGPLISSGDRVADRTAREKFIEAYGKSSSLEPGRDNAMVLQIGSDNWPMPIPIVRKGTKWFFDISKGRQEILNRRIGRNELNVIDVLDAYVDAQHEYATKDCSRSGKVEFAQKFISTDSKRDGLYWDVKEGEEASPLGPLIARASKEGYEKEGMLAPFHGYYFRILKGQGRHAKGGAYNYVVKDRMLLGFALVAYPAEYGNSGQMTFIVNQEGVVYQKDLGRNTRRIAEAMKKFDPDSSWKKVREFETGK